jgi:hypothetical protein
MVETGTYKGAGVRAAFEAGFTDVATFEIDAMLALEAKKKFAGRRVKVFNESSAGPKFFEMIMRIEQPTVFWLDAHKMGPNGRVPEDYPLSVELAEVALSQLPHVVLIDDWRLHERYGVDMAMIKALFPEHKVRFETIRERYPDDVVCLIPGGEK